MKGERIISTFVSDGLLFELIEKPETIYAGKSGFAANATDEPDIRQILHGYRNISSKITDAVEPEWWIGISIDYGKKDALKGYMFALEVTTDKQPEGVDVYQVPASIYLRLRKDDRNALRILGKDSCQGYELFPLIHDVMKRHGYQYADNGAQEIECDYSKDTGVGFVYVAAQCPEAAGR